MNRDQLIGLLHSEGEAFRACRHALSAGARFWVDAEALPASHFRAIYRRREETVRRAGIPALGFAAAVDALRAHGERLLRLGAVDLTDGTCHFQLFLDEDLTTVVACLGVDRRLGYRVRTGDRVELACVVLGWVSDEWPGWIRVQVTDVRGRSWDIVDKLPIFGVDAVPGAALPAMAAIRCRVVGTVSGDDPAKPPFVVVSTAVDGVSAEDGNDEFIVHGELLRHGTTA